MKVFTKSFLSLISFALTISFAACDDQTNDPEKPTEPVASKTESKQLVLDILVGTWKSEDGKSFEQWTRNDNGTYQSRAFSIKNADTSWNEQASVYPENNNWIFENTVKGQNDGKAVKFTSTIINEKTIQFSNPHHDFPTDINYTVADANTVNAFITGPNRTGGKDTIPFNYSRVK